MQEVFYEESAVVQNVGPAKTKYFIFKTFSIISYVIAILWLMLAIFAFPLEGNVLMNIVFAALPFVIFLLSGIFTGKIKDKFYVDYDYTFVSGSLRFSRVIKNVKRKSILVFDADCIEKLGKYGSGTYERCALSPDKKLLTLTSNVEASDGKEFYYIFAAVGGQKYLLILECTETFIANVIKFTKRTILEDEFFNKYGKK